MTMDTKLTDRLIRRVSGARAAVSISGPGSEAIGIFSWLPGGDAVFLGLLLPRLYSAQAAVAELEKLWKRPGLPDRATVLLARTP